MSSKSIPERVTMDKLKELARIAVNKRAHRDRLAIAVDDPTPPRRHQGELDPVAFG